MSNFGLHTTHETLLKTIFSQHSCINKVLLYGSRAKDNYTDRSDIDLVITESDVNRLIIGNILSEVNDSNFPYLIDLQDAETITNLDLLEHIARRGVVFYERK